MNANIFGDFLSAAVDASASYMDWQVKWLTMMTPHAGEGSESSLHGASAGGFGNQAQPTAEELAVSMDIAMGERAA
jgi:hypothetical protein